MNTLETYINEALFTDNSIDKQLDDTTGKYILNKLIEADKSLKNWGLKVSGNEISVESAVLMWPSIINKLNYLFKDLNFHFKEFKSSVNISNLADNYLPEYFQNTKFNNGLTIYNDFYNILKNINIKVDKNLTLDLSNIDKIENTNIEIINSIGLRLLLNVSLLSSKNSSKKIIEILNNLNLNKNKINSIIFGIDCENIFSLKFKNFQDAKNNSHIIADYIHDKMDYWIKRVDFLKNKKEIKISFMPFDFTNINYNIIYNLNKKEIEWID